MKRLTWAVRIDRAKQRGKFTEYEKDLAAEWTRCAVGERRGYPKTTDFVWKEVGFGISRECRLGIGFSAAVTNDRFESAEHIYGLIQALPLVMR